MTRACLILISIAKFYTNSKELLSKYLFYIIEQGRDLYLSWTIVWITEMALGSQNVFTSFVNPSTVVDLFFHPNTSLQASSYSNWQINILSMEDGNQQWNLQYNHCSSIFLNCPENSVNSLPRPEVCEYKASMPPLCWSHLGSCHHSSSGWIILSSEIINYYIIRFLHYLETWVYIFLKNPYFS